MKGVGAAMKLKSSVESGDTSRRRPVAWRVKTWTGRASPGVAAVGWVLMVLSLLLIELGSAVDQVLVTDAGGGERDNRPVDATSAVV